jgi:hypothetical protein
VRITDANADTLLANADLIVDAFDNAQSRAILSTFARAKGKAPVHAAISADGTFGLVRCDERFVPDAEDLAGQATCEGGEHLPMTAMVSATLARAIADYVKDGKKNDSMISLSGVLLQ